MAYDQTPCKSGSPHGVRIGVHFPAFAACGRLGEASGFAAAGVGGLGVEDWARPTNDAPMIRAVRIAGEARWRI